MYFLERGRVLFNVNRNKGKDFSQLGVKFEKQTKGEYFGEMAMLSYSRRAENAHVDDQQFCYL